MSNNVFKKHMINGLNYNIINSIKNKLSNKIMVGDYIIERLVQENIYYGFSYLSSDINKLTYYAEKNKTFSLIENYNEEYSGYAAFTYSVINKKPGVLISNNIDGFKSLEKPLHKNYINKNPLFLISLYTSQYYIKENYIDKYIKETYDVSDLENFPYIFEYILLKSLEIPIHLKIKDDILSKNINLDNICYYIK